MRKLVFITNYNTGTNLELNFNTFTSCIQMYIWVSVISKYLFVIGIMEHFFPFWRHVRNDNWIKPTSRINALRKIEAKADVFTHPLSKEDHPSEAIYWLLLKVVTANILLHSKNGSLKFIETNWEAQRCMARRKHVLWSEYDTFSLKLAPLY